MKILRVYKGNKHIGLVEVQEDISPNGDIRAARALFDSGSVRKSAIVKKKVSDWVLRLGDWSEGPVKLVSWGAVYSGGVVHVMERPVFRRVSEEEEK